jgi:hypothetical protein
VFKPLKNFFPHFYMTTIAHRQPSHSLNIRDYSINDIYTLFYIPPSTPLSEQHLVNAKQIVLKSHPDTSKLPSDYFIFYKQAYERLVEHYRTDTKYSGNTSSKIKKINESAADSYDSLTKDQLAVLAKRTTTIEGTNAFVMEAYDELTKGEEKRKGYAEWFRNGEVIDNEAQIEAEMKQKRQMMLYTGIQDVNVMTGGCGYQSLAGDDHITDHSSPVFYNGLAYQDLKKAHTETLILMDDGYEGKYRNMEDFKAQRSMQNNDASMKAFIEVDELAERRQMEERQRIQDALRQKEILAEQNNQSWWSKLLTLGN